MIENKHINYQSDLLDVSLESSEESEISPIIVHTKSFCKSYKYHIFIFMLVCMLLIGVVIGKSVKYKKDKIRNNINTNNKEIHIIQYKLDNPNLPSKQREILNRQLHILETNNDNLEGLPTDILTLGYIAFCLFILTVYTLIQKCLK